MSGWHCYSIGAISCTESFRDAEARAIDLEGEVSSMRKAAKSKEALGPRVSTSNDEPLFEGDLGPPSPLASLQSSVGQFPTSPLKASIDMQASDDGGKLEANAELARKMPDFLPPWQPCEGKWRPCRRIQKLS